MPASNPMQPTGTSQSTPNLFASRHRGLLALGSRLPLGSPLLLGRHQRLVLATQPLGISLQLLALQDKVCSRETRVT